MNKPLIVILIFCFFSNCSLNKNSSLWNEKEKTNNESKNIKKIIVEKKREFKELNPTLTLKLPKNFKLDKNIKPHEIISDAKKLCNKIAPKKIVFIQGIPIEVPLRGNQYKSLMAASIYTIINNSN